MFLKNTQLIYSTLAILSTGKKSFATLAQTLEKGRDSVRRLLQPSSISFDVLYQIARFVYRNTHHSTARSSYNRWDLHNSIDGKFSI